MKAIKRVKKGAKVGKPSTALLEVEGDREGRSKKEDDALAVMAAAISGKTVEQIHAKWAALRELNKRLEQPAKRRCYVRVTMPAIVDVECDGCGTDEGKRILFRKALDAWADETSGEVDEETDEIEVIVDSLFKMNLDDSAREISREKKPDASPEECIETSFL